MKGWKWKKMKETIIKLLKSTEREGIDRLIKEMELSGFFEAPASGQYHYCFPGGLAKHSLNVYQTALRFASSVQEIDEKSLILVCLLHDLGKAGDYGKRNYIENYLKSGELSKAKPYTTNTDLAYVPHEVRSIAIAERYIELTEDEEHAIYYHNGKYTHIGYDLKEKPLQMILHFADLWASRVLEVEDEV